jgi:phosphohistidine phosphatase
MESLLRRALEVYEQRARALGQDRSLAAVHDFRVASRRLMVAVGAASSAEGAGTHEDLRTILKTGLRRTNELSDTQTSIKIARRYTNEWPVLEPLCLSLVKRANSLILGLEGCIPEDDVLAVAKGVGRLCAARAGVGDAPFSDLSLLRETERRLDNESSRLRRAAGKLHAEDPDSIHELRICVRHTRYTLELFRAFAGELVNGNIASARNLQALMGDIHDNDIFYDNLKAFTEAAGGAPDGLAHFRNHFCGLQKERVDKLMKAAQKRIKDVTRQPLSAGSRPGPAEIRAARKPVIVILRHATAVERGTPGISDDAARPLTKEGRKEAKRAARAFEALSLRFSRILASPCLRALETAQIVAKYLGAPGKVEIAEALSPAGDAGQAIPAVKDRRAASCVLIVGHEPNLSILAASMTGGNGAALNLKKGGAVMLSRPGKAPGTQAVIEWLLTPEQMRLMK